MAVLNPPRTVFEVFDMLPEGTLCQIINNTLVMSPAPTDPHQEILMKISGRLFHFIDTKDIGELRVAPYDVYIDDENVYQPDIVFIAKENKHLIKEKGLFGVPDLVVEILSPGTKKYDLGPKKDVYERTGVKEYWAVDPLSKEVIFYQLHDDGFIEIPVQKGTIKSPLLGVTVKF
jgi:Uma2 family endonuclease